MNEPKRIEALDCIAEQYGALLRRIEKAELAGLGEELFKVFPGWELEIFGRWGGGLTSVTDGEELRRDDEKAAEYIRSLPGELRSMAFLCGSNGAPKQASAIMRMQERLCFCGSDS